MNIPDVTLNNGVKMPILGFGVYQIPSEETEQAVLDAVQAGYRLIDTAAAYGNEEAVGRAIARSGVAREDLFITTKLWIQRRGEAGALEAFETSMKKLGLDYLDLYLIHQPFGDYYGEWRAMEKLYKDGRIKAIGVSNFSDDRLIDLMAFSEIKPAINQMETNPFHQQVDYQNLMNRDSVKLEAWAPFAEGKNGLFTNPILTEIGTKYNKSAAQVVLRWLIQRGVIVVAKSIKLERMQQNLDVADFELTNDQMEQIATLDAGESQFFSHTDPEMVRRLTDRAES